MKNNYENLLNALDALYKVPKHCTYSKEDEVLYFDDDFHEFDVAYALCCEYLITDKGDPNYKAMEALSERGYRLKPGEMDGYGWLTGCIIRTDDERVLVFG